MDSYKGFRKKLSSSLRDETAAAKMYTNMMQMVPNPRIVAMLKEIRDDEIDHHRKLMIIRDMLR
jgi:rubrerythrin